MTMMPCSMMSADHSGRVLSAYVDSSRLRTGIGQCLAHARCQRDRGGKPLMRFAKRMAAVSSRECHAEPWD